MKYNSRSVSFILLAVSAEALGLLKGKELLLVWVDFGLSVTVQCCDLNKLLCCLWP